MIARHYFHMTSRHIYYPFSNLYATEAVEISHVLIAHFFEMMFRFLDIEFVFHINPKLMEFLIKSLKVPPLRKNEIISLSLNILEGAIHRHNYNKSTKLLRLMELDNENTPYKEVVKTSITFRLCKRFLSREIKGTFKASFPKELFGLILYHLDIVYLHNFCLVNKAFYEYLNPLGGCIFACCDQNNID
jgi:hypothetical protein